MKNKKGSNIFFQELKNGYIIMIDFDFFRVSVLAPDKSTQAKYYLDMNTPMSEISKIINNTKILN